MDIKTFEKKLAMNNSAYHQVKKLIFKLKPNNVEIGISTAFTIDFTLTWGKDTWQGKRLVIKVESWGSNKRIEIYGSGTTNQPYERIPLTPSNINKIYSAGMKVYKEMR